MTVLEGLAEAGRLKRATPSPRCAVSEPTSEPTAPARTGNPTIDRWIAEGRLVPAAVPGTILDLLPPPKGTAVGIADEVIAQRLA